MALCDSDQRLRGIVAYNCAVAHVIHVAVLASVPLLSTREVHVITRSLLIAELVGVALVTLLRVVILVRLGTGTAPEGRTLSWDFLTLPQGTGLAVIAAAAVFGFLAFAGFEGAAALGEETQHPKRDIPRALKIAIAVVGAFYLLSIVAQSLGYGTDEASVATFTGAAAPYNDLGTAYVGAWLGDLLTIAAIVSLFAIFLGTVSAAGRILYALGRDSGGSRGVARLSPAGAPTTALAVAGGLALLVVVIERLTVTSGALNATFYALTIGTIALLVAYVLATAGAIRFLFTGADKKAPAWQVVVPVLGLALVIYTIYRNAVGLDAPYSWFPYVVLAWLVVGVAISFAPGLAGRVRASLDRSQSADVAP